MDFPARKPLKPARAADRLVRILTSEPGATDRHTLSIRLVRATLETAERSGIARADFLRRTQFDAVRLEAEEGRVSPAEFSRMCEAVLDLSGDPALGLHEGQTLNGASFNIVAPLVAHAASLRRGFETLFQMHELLNDELRHQLLEQDDRATLLCATFEGVSEPVRRFMAEVELTGFCRMLSFFGAGARPTRVSFAYSEPVYRREYTRVFEGRECFDQTFTGIVFDRALLDAPSAFKDKEMHDALRMQAEQRIARIAHRVSHAERVREVLARDAAGLMDMHAVAHALGLSVRSLRRRLSAERTSYQALVNEALANIARRHLLVDRRTIQETAFAMGYAEGGAFHRAFKRWTGLTPKTFLARLR